jgi:hypothetical protein
MSDDYLFHGTGTPDPDVERLERILGRLRATTTAPAVTGVGADLRVRLRADTSVGPYTLSAPFLGPALAAAAAIVLMVGLTWRSTRPDVAQGPPALADDTSELRRGAPKRFQSEGGSPASSWQVSAIVGTPHVDAQALLGEGRMAVGQTLITGAGSRAKVAVSDIGWVDVDENTRVRLIETRDGRHRLALERGTLHASIAAPPGQFIVTTPSGTATDLGCVYSLRVNDDGSGLLTVEAGWVAFEERGRESFVPMGASSRIDRVNGAGTPRYDDTDPAFREAVDDVDGGRETARRAVSLRFVLEHARGRDAMTLWHLIPRVSAGERPGVIDALAALAPIPPSISRDAVRRLDRPALDQWWDTFGLNEASWWRKWKAAAPVSAAQAAPVQSCAETPAVRATPPPANNAGPLGDGPWWVNDDRTLWMQSATGPWHAGYNQKNVLVKPAGVIPTLSGTRIDAPAAPMDVRWVPQLRAEFQTMGLTFPTEGCWKVTATAGDRELSFVTSVRPDSGR